MSADELRKSIDEYKEQLNMIKEALRVAKDNNEKGPLETLAADLNQLVQLTQESLDAVLSKASDSTMNTTQTNTVEFTNELDSEYALFMQEMASSGAYESENGVQKPEDSIIDQETSDHSDIEDELATLLGMKCAVYHTHKWGGQPSLYNAMVSSVIPRQDNDQFKDLQVRVLFTHPTHAEMLPCPFLLEGECRFSDEQCRYSHGDIVPLSSLKEAIEPSFETVRAGSRVLVKLKPPDGEDVSLAKKSTEKYHLWHRAVVKHLDTDKRVCMVKLEHGVNTGEKRKTNNEEFSVNFEELYPLINDEDSDSDSNDSLSDTEYPQSKSSRQAMESDNQALLIEKSLQSAGPAMGEWERHTRGIGSKLMLAMGYVPGTGLGAAADGRLRPVEARAMPLGRSLDHCMELSEKYKDQDPLKVEQKLKRMQRKEEERIKRAYDREKERERRNVFNFLNKTLGDKGDKEDAPATTPTAAIKQSTNKNLNIEQFKITEETKRIEREITRLNASLTRHSAGTDGHRTVNRQIAEKNKELDILKSKGQQITNEQRLRKDKQKMTVF